MANKKEPLFIFDDQDHLLAVTTDYIESIFEETTDFPISLTITIPPIENEKADYFQGGHQVAFYDLKGNLRLFIIREIDDSDGNEVEKVVKCLPAIIQDLDEVLLKDIRPQAQTIDYVLDQILEDSRWVRWETVQLGENSTNFYYISAKDALKKAQDIWGGEYIDRIELNEKGKIGTRYIDVVYSKGENRGKRFEIGKDIQSISRTVLHYPKTALYGRGSGVQSGDGFSRKITFSDIEWSIENGNPVNKPLGQEWVGDEDARRKYGIYNPKTGNIEHRFGIVDFMDEEDPEILLEKTYNNLQIKKEPQTEYEMSITTFYGISDYEHEQVYIGDTGIARDFDIYPHILIQARVTRLRYDIGNPTIGEITIGNILELEDDQEELEWVIQKVRDNSGEWDRSGGAVTDESFPDSTPPTPTDFQAKNGFAKISLSWDFEPDVYIAEYQLYGSQTSGFVPDESNLIWRGKAGAFTHDLDVNQQWYYRLRSVNTHGTESAFTDEISGQTLQINANTQIEESTITEKLLANQAIIDTLHLHDGSITNAKISNLRWEKAQGGTAQLGGSGNGNGLLEILNSDDQLVITLNNQGIELSSGAKLIGNGGILSSFVFTSAGEWSGWQEVGYSVIGGSTKKDGFIFFTLPENFNIQQATLTTYCAPTVDYSSGGTPDYYNVKALNLYKSDTFSGAQLRYELEPWFHFTTNGTNITNDVWGSSWTPSANSNVQVQQGDITNHLNGGNNTFYVSSTSSDRSQSNFGMVLMVVNITGYKQ